MKKSNKGYWCIGVAVGVIALFWIGMVFLSFQGVELFRTLEEDASSWEEFFDWEEEEDYYYFDAKDLIQKAKRKARRTGFPEEGKAIVYSYDCLTDGEDDYEDVFSFVVVSNEQGTYHYYVQLGKYYLGGLRGIPLTEGRELRYSSYTEDREEFQEFYYEKDYELINPSTDQPFSFEATFYACPENRWNSDSSL